MLGPRLPQIGVSFVSWHQTPGSLSGGWAFNQNIVHLKYSMQIFDEHVSEQPLIRKHSDFDHTRRYMGKFNFVLWHHTSDSFTGDGARGQNLVHFKHKYNL